MASSALRASAAAVSATMSLPRILNWIGWDLNPDSLQIIPVAYAEPALKQARLEERYQFLRKGYFTLDPDSTPEKLVFNRTVTLKDAWAKEQKKQ